MITAPFNNQITYGLWTSVNDLHVLLLPITNMATTGWPKKKCWSIALELDLLTLQWLTAVKSVTIGWLNATKRNSTKKLDKTEGMKKGPAVSITVAAVKRIAFSSELVNLFHCWKRTNFTCVDFFTESFALTITDCNLGDTRMYPGVFHCVELFVTSFWTQKIYQAKTATSWNWTPQLSAPPRPNAGRLFSVAMHCWFSCIVEQLQNVRTCLSQQQIPLKRCAVVPADCKKFSSLCRCRKKAFLWW